MMHAIIRFDDNIYGSVPRKHIKHTPNSVVAKWKGSWYHTELICFANKEVCEEIVPVLNNSFPFISIEQFMPYTKQTNETIKCLPITVSSEEYITNKQINKQKCLFQSGQENYVDQTDKVIDDPSDKEVDIKECFSESLHSKLDYIQDVDLMLQYYDHNVLKYFPAETDGESSIDKNNDIIWATSFSQNVGQNSMLTDVENKREKEIADRGHSTICEADEVDGEMRPDEINEGTQSDEMYEVTRYVEMDEGTLSDEIDKGAHSDANSISDSSGDFVPSIDSSSDASSEILSPCQRKIRTVVDLEYQVKHGQAGSSINYDNVAHQNVDETDTNNHLEHVIAESMVSDEEVQVRKKPYYGKKDNFCTFCQKKNKNIVRHFQQVHQDEPEVKKFMILPKKCRQRKILIGELRLRGNFEYNSKVVHSDANFIVARRVATKQTAKSNYTACPKCKIFITKPALRRHYKNCHSNGKVANRGLLASSKAVFSDVLPLANEILKTRILPVMREDETYCLIKHDKLLIIYGNAMCMKYRSTHHYDMIRSRLRIMGKFLLLLKSINSEVKNFESVYQPQMFDYIVQALHASGEYNELTGFYEKPTLPSTIGTALKYIANLYIVECIKLRDIKKKIDVEDSLLLLKTGLQGPVNKTATESLLHKKRQKKEVLPATDDIKKLNDYLNENQAKYYQNMVDNGFSIKSWLNLLKLTLISLLVFNRRRPGELERALVSDLNSLQHISEEKSPEIFEGLSEEAKQAAKCYVRFTLRGKLARGVPVLLSKNNNKYIKYLLRFRQSAGVHIDNPYIFGLPETSQTSNRPFRYLRAVRLLKQYSQDCGVADSSRIKATLLRKHVATKSAMMNLGSHDVENLQNFLGHEAKIHNDYYRQPLINRDIINMSKLLEIAQGGEKNRVSLDESEIYFAGTTNNTSSLSDSSYDGTGPSSSIEKRKRCLSTSSLSEEAPTLPIKKRKRSRLIDMDLGYVPRRSWTTPERETAHELFGNFIEQQTLPSVKQCKILTKNNSMLPKRSPQQIRLWIRNQIVKASKSTEAMTTKPVISKRSWSTREKNIIKEIFGNYIIPECNTYPGTKQLEEAILKYDELANRTPQMIRSQIQHLKTLQAKHLEF